MQKTLKKDVLGLPSLVAVAAGLVVAQGTLVTVLFGAGIAGYGFFLALFVGFILSICYIMSFSELALMFPRAGAISTYTEVALGHFPAIIAPLAGYVAPAIFALSAELLLLEYILRQVFAITAGFSGCFALVILLLFTCLNILGINIFARVQSALSFTMLTALALIGAIAVFGSPANTAAISVGAVPGVAWSALGLTALAIWAFLGFEFVCPLIEESKRPERNIPMSMFIAAFLLFAIYGALAYAGLKFLPVETLAGSASPHADLMNAMFGSPGVFLLAVLAVTASCSTVNTVLATVPRMLFGMAQNGQLPQLFGAVQRRYGTPWISILVLFGLVALPIILLRQEIDVIMQFLISAAAAWLIAYIIVHLDLILLRSRLPNFRRPFKAPFFPLPQIVGVAGLIYAFLHSAPAPELAMGIYTNTGVVLGLAAIYAFFWVKFVMKKGLFEPEPHTNIVPE